MKRVLMFKWSILLLAVYLVASLYLFFITPAQAMVPMHWNIKNQIDGWITREAHLPLGIGLMVGIWAMIFLMPYYSPWYKNYGERNEKIMPGLANIMVICLGALNLYSQWVAYKGGEPEGVSVILIIIGVLMLGLGNLMPKIPKNYFMGIKTPWTLSHEDIWHRTHRLGGLLFFLSGLLLIVKGFISSTYGLFHLISAIVALVMLLYPLPYSFLLYKKLGKS